MCVSGNAWERQDKSKKKCFQNSRRTFFNFPKLPYVFRYKMKTKFVAMTNDEWCRLTQDEQTAIQTNALCRYGTLDANVCINKYRELKEEYHKNFSLDIKNDGSGVVGHIVSAKGRRNNLAEPAPPLPWCAASCEGWETRGAYVCPR